MASKALQIRDAIITLLTTPALTGIGSGGVSVDPDYAFEARDLPVVAVYLGDEAAEDHTTIGVMDRTLTLNVRVISKGSDAFSAGDTVLVQAYNRIVTDRTIGGLALDLNHQGTHRSRDVLEMPVAITDLEFAVMYRTGTTSLES